MLIELLFGIIFFVMPIVGMFMTILLTGERGVRSQHPKRHTSIDSAQRITRGIIHQHPYKVFEGESRLHPSFKRHIKNYLYGLWILDTS
jgi:hypothetical protein